MENQTHQQSGPLVFVAGIPRAVKILIVGLVVLVILFIAVALGVQSFKATRNTPLDFEVYPGAHQEFKRSTGPSSETQLFTTTDTPQQVLNFYQSRMPQTSADDSKITGCKKVYTDAVHSEDLGHFYVRCIRDESVLDVPQTLAITVNYQKSDQSNSFMTFIQVDRTWGK